MKQKFFSPTIITGCVLALVTVLLIGVLLFRSIQEQVRTADWVTHTHEMLEETQNLISRLSDAENGRRGYVLTGSERYLAHHRTGVRLAGNSFTALRRLTGDDPRQQAGCNALEPLLRERMSIFAESVARQMEKGPDPEAQLAFMERGQEAMERIRRQVARMSADQRLVLRLRERAAKESASRTIQIAVAGSGLSLVILTWVFVLLAREDLRRRRAEADLQTANEELEDRVEERAAELRRTQRNLREKEERLRLIIDTALDAVITINDRGTVTGWSRQAEAVFGWKADEIVGQRLSETIIPVQYREAHERGLRRYSESREGPVLNRRIEISAVCRDGREIPVELAITPVQIGSEIFFSAFVRDITERKRGEAEIRRLNEELEQRVAERTAQLEAVNKELEAFSYSVSHDLRAPLRHIDGFVEMLQHDARASLPERGRRYLEIISDSARRMGALIDDLLVFSRMGRTEMCRAPVDLRAMVNEIVEGMEPELKGRTITWDVGELPVVNGDGAMLRQVWVNLLSNAVKYTRHRERAEIRIGAQEKDGFFEFLVKDNGAGFDMAFVHKLFGVFQRLHHAEEFEGTGIGLANVRRIVARHGGATWAEGKVGDGATFYFTLPAKG